MDKNIRNQNSIFSSRKGFSLVEVLAAVIISAILAAAGAIAIVNYVKTYDVMKQDAYAEQVYIAAQNQITELKSSGIWNAYAKDYESMKDSGYDGRYGALVSVKPSDYEAVKETSGYSGDWDLGDYPDKEYLLVLSHTAVNNSETMGDIKIQADDPDGTEDPDQAMLDIILPNASIASSVRDNGQYFIEYNIRTGTVYAVWYTEHSSDDEQIDYARDVLGTSGSEGKVENVLNATVTSGNAEVSGRPLQATEAETVNARTYRREHKNSGGKTVRVGYFSGMLASLEEADLLEPEAEVINGEELKLIITDPNSTDINSLESRITYEIEGLSSGMLQSADIAYEEVSLNGTPAHAWVSSVKGKDESSEVTVNNVTAENTEDGKAVRYIITLDSITSDEKGTVPELTDRHFRSMFRDFDGEDGNGIAGENISIKVISKPVQKLGSSKFRTVMANSLYGSLETEKDSSGNVVKNNVEISQMRHLENLDADVSGAALKNIYAVLAKNITFDGTSAELDSTSAGDKAARLKEEYTELLMGVDYTDDDYAYITKCAKNGNLGSSFEGFKEKSYIPVTNSELRSFKGSEKVSEKLTEYALINNVRIKTDAENEKTRDIGIFGTYEGTELANFGVINYTPGNHENSVRKCEFDGYGALGGIAGTWKYPSASEAGRVFANVKLTVKKGAAASYAGGLFGICDTPGYAALDIKDSYTGGFTKLTRYEAYDPNIGCAGDAGAVTMGGLIGQANGSNIFINNVFTTESVGIPAGYAGQAALGGLVGKAGTLKEFKNTYSAAPVIIMADISVNAVYDPLIASCASVASASDNAYLRELGTVGREIKSTADAAALSISGNAAKAYYLMEQPEAARITTYPVDPYINEKYYYEDVTGIGTFYGDWSIAPNEYYVRAHVTPVWYDTKTGGTQKQIGANRWLDLTAVAPGEEDDITVMPNTGSSARGSTVSFNTSRWQRTDQDYTFYYNATLKDTGIPSSLAPESLITSFNGKEFKYYDYGAKGTDGKDNNFRVLYVTQDDANVTERQDAALLVEYEYLQTFALFYDEDLNSSAYHAWNVTPAVSESGTISWAKN